MCVYCTVHNCCTHTILHKTDLIILCIALQTMNIPPMMSIWGKRKESTTQSEPFNERRAGRPTWLYEYVLHNNSVIFNNTLMRVSDNVLAPQPAELIGDPKPYKALKYMSTVWHGHGGRNSKIKQADAFYTRLQRFCCRFSQIDELIRVAVVEPGNN